MPIFGKVNLKVLLMVISHKKKFVMYLPWKTASQTIELRLRAFNESPYDLFFYFNPFLNRVVHQHITCCEFMNFPESKLNYFSASFVRNPYDRVYSGFRQLQKDIQYQPLGSYPAPWIKNHVMKQLTENFAQLCLSQFNFDNWLEQIGEEQIFEIGRNTNFPLHPSYYWTHIDGKQVVDWIGHVENFETDFQEFTLRVNLGEVPKLNTNIIELKDGAPYNPYGYRYVDRMSKQSIDKINNLFEKDFSLFDYIKLQV